MPWPEIELGDVCEFKYGKSLAARDRDGGNFSVYGSNGVVGGHSTAITSGPTIIVGRKGSFGEVAYSEFACWPIDTTYYVDSTSTKADLKWLAYRLEDLGLTKLNRAAAIPGLNRADAYRQRLLLPPVDEQRRIVAILDKADALRAKRREAIAKLDQLLQSVFLDMFGDPATNLKGWAMGVISDLLESVKYGTSEKADLAGNVPILRMSNITYNGEVDLSGLKYLRAESVDNKYLVKPGDLLFNRTNSKELVGKAAVYEGPVPMAYAGYLVRARPRQAAASTYISGFLNSAYGKATLRGMCKSIVGMANINAREFAAISIPLPPQPLQDNYASKVRSIKARRTALVHQQIALDSLFASLQHRAFSGTL